MLLLSETKLHRKQGGHYKICLKKQNLIFEKPLLLATKIATPGRNANNKVVFIGKNVLY